MKYCKNCGKQLPDDAKFCVDCGTPTEEASSKKRVEQAGTIYKCPNCGEVLESMTAVCPACRYEIRNTKASTASKEFSEKLSVLTSSEQKISLIQSFPIPNTKEDVYDFLVLTAGNLNALTLGVSIQSGDGAKEQMDVAAAWYSKLHQCYQKASLLFKDDAELERIRKLCTEANSNYRTANSRWKMELAKASKKEERHQRRQEHIFAKQPPLVVYQEPVSVRTQLWKNKWVSWILCLFFGFLGAHKFYEGKTGEGFLYLFTVGLCGIGWIVDIFILLFKPNPYAVIKKK